MIAFAVPGAPGPQGSRTPGKRKNGSLYTRPSSKRGHGWMETVAQYALIERSKHGTLLPPYRVTLFFWVTKARTSKLEWPSDDVDKLARATLDGFTHGGLIEDDRYVISLHADKDFHRADLGPGVEVTILSGAEARQETLTTVEGSERKEEDPSYRSFGHHGEPELWSRLGEVGLL